MLRELQLNLCRRKLTLATARASSKHSGIEKTQNGDDMMEIVDEDDEMMEDDPILEDEQLREDETKIIALTKELEELSRNNTSAISEVVSLMRSSILPDMMIKFFKNHFPTRRQLKGLTRFVRENERKWRQELMEAGLTLKPAVKS